MATTTKIYEDAERIDWLIDYGNGMSCQSTEWKAGSTGDNQDKIIAKLSAALDTLETADADWDTLTTAQKVAAARFAVRVSAKLVRLTLGRLEAN